MQKFKTKAKIAAVATAFTIALAGLTIPTATASSSDVGLADEELVLGLVFGIGEFAEEIGTAADVRAAPGDSADEAAMMYEESASKVTAELLSQYDTLAPALDLIRSGDPVLTEQAFVTIGGVLDSYSETQVDQLTQANKGDMQVAVSPCGVAVVCWAYAAAAVHNTVVVTGAAAVVVAAALWCGAWAWCGNSSTDGATEESQLTRERFVVDVTLAAGEI